MVTFVDQVTLHLRAGNGGDGCISVKREKFKPLAGPDGADGGNGGSISLISDPNVTTLLDFHFNSHRAGGDGGDGAGDFRNGATGKDVVLPVPVGTVVRSADGKIIADLDEPGIELVVAEGGQGGLGNAALASSKRKAPGFALLGVPGWSGDIILELKSVADVALVGYPSAGKSSLIAAISSAKPKIADYPFTTLHPNLGVVQAGQTRFTAADVPGLIPGASQGKGLGHEFLRHVERCAALVHVLDCATLETDRDPIKDFDVIEEELKEYGGLADRPRIIALNKIDLPDGKAMADMVQKTLEARGFPVFQVSAASREGMQELIYGMAQIIQTVRKAQKEEQVARIVLRPMAVDDAGFIVIANEDGTFNVIGDKPERWVKQTDFANAEAIGYLADRLASYGVEKELFKKGAKAGDEVRIGSGDEAVIFDWEPSIEAGAELLAGGPRGEDLRLSTPWRMDLLEDDIDQLNDDEIEMQWEYNVANPRTPRVDEDVR